MESEEIMIPTLRNRPRLEVISILFSTVSHEACVVWKLREFESWDRSIAGTERVHIGPQSAQELNVQVAQRRILSGIEGQVLAVLESSARDDNRQILVVVAAGVSQIAAEQNDRSVQQRAARFLRLFQLCQQFSEQLHLLKFDDPQFCKFRRVLSVM